MLSLRQQLRQQSRNPTSPKRRTSRPTERLKAPRHARRCCSSSIGETILLHQLHTPVCNGSMSPRYAAAKQARTVMPSGSACWSRQLATFAASMVCLRKANGTVFA